MQQPILRDTKADHLPGSDVVTIPRFEYENLVLIYGTDTSSPQPSTQNSYENHSNLHSVNVSNGKPVDPVVSVTSAGEENGYGNHGYKANHRNGGDSYNGVGHSDEDEDEDADAYADADALAVQGHNEKDGSNGSLKSGRSSYAVPTAGQRTVILRGLPDRVTHYDITEAVRGGALLDVYLRNREHMASISFVEESAAREFLNYVKQHDIYVAGKRVEALWSERQFYLPPYVRAKINSGASRNLVIFNVNPNITESLIRRDLEHIHNLIVISVEYKHGNVYVSTNSVHNALFARSCMMSRFAYKRMRISFYQDDCAEPLPKIQPVSKADLSSNARSKKPAPLPNRFELLSIEDSVEDSDDDRGDFDDHSSTLGSGIGWADRDSGTILA